MGGGMGLGAGGTSSNDTSNVSKITNTENTSVKYKPENTSDFGKIDFNISDRNTLPGEGGQPVGENSSNESKQEKISKSKNYIFFIIAILTLFFLLLKHKVINV